ncbi:hypothetical protein GGQ92_000179 [Gracilibacillus halotolerans]|uniref:UPF0122 protein GGQ92_000179 n=1 Tax=Gracilibacillus halotolerans TaxID=74386 RepID=A0A841RH98_9BACI|nr:putative DNA-binding protein [Gracilibacillus halotolerans]MBB6511412.1 hypothetical protein [Gracilibacillus halotolerans]
MLDKTTRINSLYDFYQELLTEKQRNYMEMYYREDFSLGEIAEEVNVSRQAIYDNVKRTEQMLEEYEEKLQLFDKFTKRQALILELKKRIDKEDQEIVTLVNKIIDLE